MSNTFITGLEIKNVRHLNNIHIPLDINNRKHLILTGKNGSGKTSVIEAIKKHIQALLNNNPSSEEDYKQWIKNEESCIVKEEKTEKDKLNNAQHRNAIKSMKEGLLFWQTGVVAKFTSYAELKNKYENGLYVIASYSDNRLVKMETYTNIEHVEHKSKYSFDENPGSKLAKYLVNMKATQAFADQNKDKKRSEEIKQWFERFENILQDVFDDDSLILKFNINDFQFTIEEKNRLPFTFNTMSSGYAAIFDIINDLIMRMEKYGTYSLEGIVLIDEIETHLHLNLQKKIMPILTKLFPNIQFIITTHSPFILSSVDNAVVYDLEKKTL